jgi:hypothetical protein
MNPVWNDAQCDANGPATEVKVRAHEEVWAELPATRIYRSVGDDASLPPHGASVASHGASVAPHGADPTTVPPPHVMPPQVEPVPVFHGPSPTFTLCLQPLYTEDELTHCGGRFSCTNCDRPIAERMIFVPQEQTATGGYVFDPAPYCCVPCAYRGMMDMRNHFDYVSLFALVYGTSFRPAPPRRLLKIKGGLSLEAYHAQTQTPTQTHTSTSHWEEDLARVRCFMGPIYLAHTLTDKFQLWHPHGPKAVPHHGSTHPNESGAVSYQPSINTALGPLPDRTTTHVSVVALTPKPIVSPSLAALYTLDKATADRATT